MKHKISETIEIPEGIQCSIKTKVLKVSKLGKELSRNLAIPYTNITIENNKIVFESEKGSKREFKFINSAIAHIKNMFHGLEKEYVYTLEACNVHFPMTLKVEKNNLFINNFLGEKTPRTAEIPKNVRAEIKAQKIILSSFDKEAVGQAATNIEKATKVRNRDRRVFQDGIFLVERSVKNG